MYVHTHMRRASIGAVAAVLAVTSITTLAATKITGSVVDTNGNSVAQAQVVFDRDEGAPGASVVTVFTNAQGEFSFPGAYPEAFDATTAITVRALGYRAADAVMRNTAHGADTHLALTLIVSRTDNQADVAPPSAWLRRLSDRRQQSDFIMSCIDCHQVPAPEVRNYAASIADLHAADPVAARAQSWNAIVKYMNYLSAWEFSRGARDTGEKVDADAVYSVTNGEQVAATLTRIFDDRLDTVSGFDWGAPVIADENTVIWEYEVPHPNAVREALMLGDPAKLWIADVSSNRMFAVDVATGKQEVHEVPVDVLMSPHSLHRGQDGSLWVTPLFNSIVGHLDIKSGKWQTWRLRTPDGKDPGIHDLSFGYEHELLTDKDGLIWFSDIGNNSVGYFDPRDGKSEVWEAPPSPGRDGATSLYGLIMTKDRKEVWYSQLANGTFGGFDIEKREYIGPFQFPDPNAGPRRITIDDNDIIYFALYGSGQLAAFDAKARKMVGVYDLPDTASAPYSATWDPVRRVVWIPTSNGDVIYRFDPATTTFGVLPLPRTQTFLRMVDVDPQTGVLISSYANIVDVVQGPRMALIIEPGDNAYPKKFTRATLPEANQ
ncbi:MAG: carboxypeptidase regulatory-like domain-containing protein [Gammaproteobacteria bacterium]|nr:carboxypeptidase regulatory-like domain-containing protein [Gammaproteobacteria bacterium]